MRNKWERRDNKRNKRKDSNFKVGDYDLLEKESAKKMSKQKREWAIPYKTFDIDEDAEDYNKFN